MLIQCIFQLIYRIDKINDCCKHKINIKYLMFNILLIKYIMF